MDGDLGGILIKGVFTSCKPRNSGPAEEPQSCEEKRRRCEVAEKLMMDHTERHQPFWVFLHVITVCIVCTGTLLPEAGIYRHALSQTRRCTTTNTSTTAFILLDNTIYPGI